MQSKSLIEEEKKEELPQINEESEDPSDKSRDFYEYFSVHLEENEGTDSPLSNLQLPDKSDSKHDFTGIIHKTPKFSHSAKGYFEFSGFKESVNSGIKSSNYEFMGRKGGEEKHLNRKGFDEYTREPMITRGDASTKRYENKRRTSLTQTVGGPFKHHSPHSVHSEYPPKHSSPQIFISKMSQEEEILRNSHSIQNTHEHSEPSTNNPLYIYDKKEELYIYMNIYSGCTGANPSHASTNNKGQFGMSF